MSSKRGNGSKQSGEVYILTAVMQISSEHRAACLLALTPASQTRSGRLRHRWGEKACGDCSTQAVSLCYILYPPFDADNTLAQDGQKRPLGNVAG